MMLFQTMARKLTEEVTFELILVLGGEEYCRQREHLVRDPEAGMCLTCSRNTKEASVAGTK